MTTRAFNQYMEMYYTEHPDFPDNIGELIQDVYKGPEDTARILVNTIDSSRENIFVSHHSLEANCLCKQHSHDYFELMYVSKGSCTQKIGAVPCNLSAGDFCLLNPYVTHEIDIDSAETLLFNIMIRQNLLRESFFSMIAGNDLISNFFATSLFTESQQKSYLYVPGGKNTAAASHIQALIIEFYEKKMGYQKAAENYLALLFMELARSLQNQIDQENYTMMGGNLLSEILAYINQHKLEVTLTSVAEQFHYHPKYLSSLIKRYTHKSFSEILLEAKLQDVCCYLKNTSLSIDEISQLMGYYDRSYFNRLFKKTFQMSPGQYRKIYQK
ncbi:MAG: AraC family transcriptional regulator [Lachnospiraceae bacterium]|jgi:AraC-like DNA-binding protein/quercetin dioxygenase-like cupin family protein|nr:AraC family transcriptional regulator [Lachnospiraceae bacterium]